MAEALEAALGVGFIRHGSKKPSGNADALEARFGCGADHLVMVVGPARYCRPPHPTDFEPYFLELPGIL